VKLQLIFGEGLVSVVRRGQQECFREEFHYGISLLVAALPFGLLTFD
jgi:hypothetical protein